MPLLSFLAEAFIGFFGITQPAEKQRRLVHLLLGGFLLAVSLFALGVIAFFVWLHARG